MLALDTGWTPDVIAELPQPFRAACHWVIFTRAIIGPEGFPNTELPAGADITARLHAAKLSIAVDHTRKLLFPEGDD